MHAYAYAYAYAGTASLLGLHEHPQDGRPRRHVRPLRAQLSRAQRRGRLRAHHRHPAPELHPGAPKEVCVYVCIHAWMYMYVVIQLLSFIPERPRRCCVLPNAA